MGEKSGSGGIESHGEITPAHRDRSPRHGCTFQRLPGPDGLALSWIGPAIGPCLYLCIDIIGIKKPVLFRGSVDRVVQRDRISAFIDLSVVGMFVLLPSGTWILSGRLSFSVYSCGESFFWPPHA